MAKVVKFGGSSLSGAEQFKKVAEIIHADTERRYVVPSAPGVRSHVSGDKKITDMLYKCYDDIASGKQRDVSSAFSLIDERFQEIITELGLREDLLKEEYKKIVKNFQVGKEAGFGRDYAASRGEYLNGIILAEYLGFDFVDAARVVKFKADGTLDVDLTDDFLNHSLGGYVHAVIPGFYGSMPDDTIKTFSRGGSDITGALVAKAINAELYENWTDVSGFLVADPRIVKEPEVIEVITYRELRELSYMGATVLHEDTIFPVSEAGIPINIKNTNEPSAPGTMIVPEEKNIPARLITGIAGKKNFSVIHIEKHRMNSEIGFLRRILSVFEVSGINFEHMPTGIDTLSVVLESGAFEKHPNIIERLRKVARPDLIERQDNIALLAVVGRGMREKKGTAGRIFASLSHADINIRIIDQGSSELNIIIGVDESDFEQAIRVIYDMFMLSE